MGMLLPKPSMTVLVESDRSDKSNIKYAVGEMQGWRRSMEDAHIATIDLESPNLQSNIKHVSIFGVFDGHGGKEVAKFTQDRYISVLLSIPEFEQLNFHLALKKSFHKIDELLEDESYNEVLKQYRALPNPSDTIDKIAVHPDRYNSNGTVGPSNSVITTTNTNAISTATNPSNDKKMRLTTTLAANIFKRLLSAEDNETDISNFPNTNEETISPNSSPDLPDSNSPNPDISMDELIEEITESFKTNSLNENELEETWVESDAINLSEVIRNADSPIESEIIEKTDFVVTNQETSVVEVDEVVEEKSPKTVSTVSTNKTIVTGPSKLNPTRPTYRMSARGRPACQLKSHRVIAGCTAVVVLKHGNKLYVANAGDSRAVLCRGNGSAFALSEDHKPLQSTEMKRIESAGGFVTAEGRINGNLNLSRSLGDLKYKQVSGIPRENQMITAEPDIKEVDLLPDDHFIIIACDGIWDCMTNQRACDFVRQRIEEGMPIDEIVKEVCHACLSDDLHKNQGIGTDNMTCMIVLLK